MKHTKICSFCLKSLSNYSIYKITLKTSKATYEIGILTLLEKIEDWIFQRMYHLSASQILLLRPDLIYEFFEQYKPNEKIVEWNFIGYEVCKKCFESYKSCVPTK